MAKLGLRLLIIFMNLFIAISFVSTESPNETLRSKRQVNQVRISEQKCKDYKEIYRVIYHSNLPYPHNRHINGPLKCPTFHAPHIVGGVPALPNEFPHMVSLMYRQRQGVAVSHGCGGTLISERFVLTAAHCIDTESGPPLRALLGELSLKPPAHLTKTNRWSTFPSRQFPRKEVYVNRTYVHPKYNPGNSAYHDIALVELSENIKFIRSRTNRPKIRPACLAQPNQFNLDRVIATGWGKLGTNHDDIHNILQKVNLTVVPARTCGASYRSTQSNVRLKFPNEITSDQVCAGDVGKDTCSGDSGGPIQVSQKDLPCMQYVVGITSLGPDNCGSGSPAVYTRVDKYLDWIEGIVWKQ